MNIQITTRHDRKVSDETKSFIEAEIEALEKFDANITSAHVVLDKEAHKTGEEDIVEVDLKSHGIPVSAKATGENLLKAFDSVMEKITVQIKKKSEKLKSHK